MADNSDEHLSQQEIPDVASVLQDLGLWLERSDFVQKEEGVEKCIDEGLPKAAGVLFATIGSHQKVSGLSNLIVDDVILTKHS
jgi:hypothetical protein